MKAETVKTVGYLISSGSVVLLGAAAWPGAEKAGLIGFLVAGMAASIVGMACRWWSYEMDKRRKASGGQVPLGGSPPPPRPSRRLT